MSASPTPAADSTRLFSLDAYRGAIMLLMVTAGLGIPQVAKSFTHSPVWQFLAYETDHAVWSGCSLWDLIQPSFMFMVGVAIPFSHASRLAKGDSKLQIAGHVGWRAVVLCLLGIFLTASAHNLQFMNVLTQIGLGYVFVYLLVGRGVIVQLTAAVGFMLIHWLIFYVHKPTDPFAYSMLRDPLRGVAPYTELFAHWNPVTNAGAEIDYMFLNLFPRNKRFDYNDHGYVTVNFISSMATMIFGLVAGEFLRRKDLAPTRKLAWLTIAAAAFLAVGYGMAHTVCPSIKKIWTPSWAVFSTGWTFAFLAAFYGVIDVVGWKDWTWPLRVVGMNSIAVYCMSMMMKPWVVGMFERHLGSAIFLGTYFQIKLFHPAYEPMAKMIVFTSCVWLAAAWMARKKIFVRI